jgi:predicted nucleic acid-binding protein
MTKREGISLSRFLCPVHQAANARALAAGHKAASPESEHALSRLMSQAEFDIDHRRAALDAIDHWTIQRTLSFVDCYHLALTRELGMTEIYTFDKQMERYPGVSRVEP